MKYLCMALIKLYRKVISPLKPYPTCRFTPSCSEYALEAFREWGFFAGLGLSIWRILRCNPFGTPGFDPVPKRKRKAPRCEKTEDEPPLSETSEKNITNEEKTS